MRADFSLALCRTAAFAFGAVFGEVLGETFFFMLFDERALLDCLPLLSFLAIFSVQLVNRNILLEILYVDRNKLLPLKL